MRVIGTCVRVLLAGGVLATGVGAFAVEEPGVPTATSGGQAGNEKRTWKETDAPAGTPMQHFARMVIRADS